MGFGWAKPVPVDWRNFANPRKDMMFVSLAGPLSNIALAVLCSAFLRMISPYENEFLFILMSLAVYINVALAVFNMLPLYPLDGSSILKGLVSRELAIKLAALDRMGGFFILGAFLLDHFLHTGILWLVIGFPILWVVRLLSQDAFPMLQEVLMIAFS